MSEDDKFYEKYLRYKIKYIELKSIMEAGGIKKRIKNKTRSTFGSMSDTEKVAYTKRTADKKLFDELKKKYNVYKQKLKKAREQLNKAKLQIQKKRKKHIPITKEETDNLIGLEELVKNTEKKYNEYKKKLDTAGAHFTQSSEDFIKQQAKEKEEARSKELNKIEFESRKQISKLEAKKAVDERKAYKRKLSEENLKLAEERKAATRRAKAEEMAIINASNAQMKQAAIEANIKKEELRQATLMQKQELEAARKQEESRVANEISKMKAEHKIAAKYAPKTSPREEGLSLEINMLKAKLDMLEKKLHEKEISSKDTYQDSDEESNNKYNIYEPPFDITILY